MSYRIVYTPSAKLKGGAGGDTTPPVESYDLGQKVRAALAAGVFKGLKWTVVGMAIAGAILGLAAAVDLFPPTIWIIAASVAIIAVSTVRGLWEACERGYDWSVRAAARAWDVDDAEIKRRRDREDAELRIQQQLADSAKDRTTRGDDADGNPLTLTDKQRLDMVAINMLERIYIHGRPATRDAMTRDGVCMQFEWNLVNAGMKAIGLRDKKTWQPSSFQDAWVRWQENVRLETDGEGNRFLEVLKQNGNWHAIERVE